MKDRARWRRAPHARLSALAAARVMVSVTERRANATAITTTLASRATTRRRDARMTAPSTGRAMHPVSAYVTTAGLVKAVNGHVRMAALAMGIVWERRAAANAIKAGQARTAHGPIAMGAAMVMVCARRMATVNAFPGSLERTAQVLLIRTTQHLISPHHALHLVLLSRPSLPFLFIQCTRATRHAPTAVNASTAIRRVESAYARPVTLGTAASYAPARLCAPVMVDAARMVYVTATRGIVGPDARSPTRSSSARSTARVLVRASMGNATAPMGTLERTAA